jgi:hypothetical protein
MTPLSPSFNSASGAPTSTDVESMKNMLWEKWKKIKQEKLNLKKQFDEMEDRKGTEDELAPVTK